MEEQDLRAMVRAGLEQYAAEADVTVPVAERARQEVRRRRRARWSVAAVAAAVVLVVGGVAVATRGGGDTDRAPVADGTSAVETAPLDTTGWRTEYWGPVAVDVPPDWGYGGAPLPYNDLTVCAPGSPPGYVGRPILQTDVCTYLESGWQPDAPYVWLGAEIEPGEKEWGNGYVQETIELGGTTVTVGSDDAALRAAVLASAREERICRPRLDRLPEGRRDSTFEGTGSFREGTLCAYRDIGDGLRLAYAAPLDEATIEATWAALDDAPASERDVDCDPSEVAVVSAVYNDPYSSDRNLWLHWDAVYRTSCGLVDAGARFLEEGAKVVDLTDALVEPWADPGVRTTLGYFIGPQG